MKYQILFAGENTKNISKCCLLKTLPRVLRVKVPVTIEADDISESISESLFIFFFLLLFRENKAYFT